MPSPVPIYRDGGETYHADMCAPLTQAVDRRQVRLQAVVHGHYPGKRLPRGALSEVKTIGYWDADQDQDWGLPWHRNEGVEFTFLESGHLGFAVDDFECTLQPDDLTVTRPWQQHRVGSPNVGLGRLHWLILDVGVRRPNQAWKWPPWILLSEPDLEELTNVLRHNEQPVWRASPEIGRCFQWISEAVRQETVVSTVSRLAVHVNDLFLRLVDLFRRHDVALDKSLSSSRRTVELFLADLRANPEHLALQWTLEDMAGSCGLGVTQFVYHVKRLANMTPLHYLNHCRLDLAAGLLRERREAAITDVALSCGFCSSQYFATAFSRRFGCSPREFRAGRRAHRAT
ncbi:MAG: helix-turn-helix transcriptional regulator [Acidobacteria bacterium]|nr:helix-turn-helix transcriptional regulator [Acidobacteriota bacterium]